MNRLRFPQGLYGITPEWDDIPRLVEAITTAARHGMRVLQLRRKHSDAAALEQLARALVPVCHGLNVRLIINDDWRLAKAVGADGVHIGKDDGELGEARAALGPDALIGASCYNDPQLGLAALAAGVDYIAFGAVYPSSSKPQATQASLDVIRQMRAHVDTLAQPRPAVVAIGGITPDNAAAVAAAGADALALIAGLFEATDIAAAATACSQLYSQNGSHHVT